MTLSPLGDRALLITVAEVVTEQAHARVSAVAQAIAAAKIPGVSETVPGPLALAVDLAPGAERSRVQTALEAVLASVPEKPTVAPPREMEIPVCYGGEFGPDLGRVATQAGLTPAAVIQLHSRPTYRVQAIGFAPGFPYLSGLPKALHSPRRATPRARVEAGTVGIGGSQTGVYSVPTPGGWQLIGRTPHPLFEPTADPPSWLRAGDRVKFVAIDRAEFDRLVAVVAETRREHLGAPSPARATTPVFEVVQPGVQATVQDLGRHGWQAQGVSVGGALDPIALRIANLIVGNAPETAALEWARRGPVLRALVDCMVAVTGVALESNRSWRPWRLSAGEVIDLRNAVKGMRGYLAVGGGIDVPVVLGSRSTCLAGRFGGYRGRTIAAGDVLGGEPPPLVEQRTRWFVGPDWQEQHEETVEVRIVRGPHADRFSVVAWRVLTESTFQVRPESDRRGLRLQGAKIAPDEPQELVSLPVAAGAIQVPPDGHPAILLADRQTLGGYPQIGYVITADVPRLARLRPGDRLRLSEVTLDEADQAQLDLERDLALLEIGLRAKR